MQLRTHTLKSFLLYTALVFVLTGCAATGPSFSTVKQSIPDLISDQARLYFIRDSSFINSGLTARVHINGANIANLNMDGFVYVDRPAGAAQIMIDAPLNFGEAARMVRLEGGKTYYFYVANNSSNVWAGSLFGVYGAVSQGGGRFAFTQIPPEMGAEQIKTKKWSGG